MHTINQYVAEMLREDTGINAFDSGGVNGRLWQRNTDKSVIAFKSEPVCDVEICETDDISISYNLYHYLTNFLSVTDESEHLDGMLQNIIESEQFDQLHRDITEFVNHVSANTIRNVNTYNYDNVLSGILQYRIIEIEDDWGTESYIILQIHTGADIRGGYTKPKVFALDDYEYFMMAQTDVHAYCSCGSWSSDDCGYNWYGDQSNGTNAPDSWLYDSESSLILCTRCGEPVNFSVMEDY